MKFYIRNRGLFIHVPVLLTLLAALMFGYETIVLDNPIELFSLLEKLSCIVLGLAAVVLLTGFGFNQYFHAVVGRYLNPDKSNIESEITEFKQKLS